MDSDPEFGEERNINDFDSFQKEGSVGFDRRNSKGATMKSLESEQDLEE